MKTSDDALDRLLATAASAQRSGQFAAANQAALQAVGLSPHSFAANFLLAMSCARLGDVRTAIRALETALELNPTSLEALISLANLQLETGQFGPAESTARRVTELKPGDAQALNLLGRSYLGVRELDKAIECFERASALQPAFAAAHHNLGKAKQLLGKDAEAADAFHRAATLAPTMDNLSAYVQMLFTLCDYHGALGCARELVGRFPESAAAHLLLCGALTESGDLEGAEEQLRKAIALDPEGREALQTAVRQRPLGHIEEANSNLRLALERNPRQISAFDAFMQNTRCSEEDRPLIERMRGVLDGGGLSPTELVSLHYGLGKAREDLGEFREAMGHYDEANRITHALRFGDVPFDRDAYRAHVDRMIEVFTPVVENAASRPSPHLQTRTRSEREPARAILVVGMPRSGTSLTEQVLSSHPDVGGAGEQLFWSRNWGRALRPDGTCDPAEVRRLGEEYVEHLRTVVPGRPAVTDKMPGNHMFLGLIHQALPEARIVHVRRSPIDTCISLWATPNHMPQEGGNHKGNTVYVYRQYLRLMEHWRAVLPSDRFFELDYERLVGEPEPVVRALLEFCGLEWNEACLRPEETKRLVVTPSAWQVRQPFYRTSVERWRKFEPWLGEFAELAPLE